MKKIFLIVGLLLVSAFILGACGNVENIQHVEVFVIETLEENDEGISEITGYKKVNAITYTETSENHVETDIKAIEDFYDTEGNYIRTEIIHSTFDKSHITKAEDGEDRKEEIQEPSTILIPDESMEQFKFYDMTKEEEEKVKEHVLSFMDIL
ncbi:hypothetical protein [Planococcus sp. CAU13]|uniref:hypothetical protein n=1 Tax=Planococcus sp. CAU13 TaxID=1541197 RepID=UPI0005300260|nr:hypothetical protein [Planococcus sp. CAU13]